MAARTYMTAIDTAVRAGVPETLGTVHHQDRGWQSKWWYGNPALHYEATPRVREKAIEIGLHFEADPLTNARLLAAFRAHAKAITRRLGAVRIDEWDRGWARVWEPITLSTPLGVDNGSAVGKRVARYITVLEPILRDELPGDVEWRVETTARRLTRASRR